MHRHRELCERAVDSLEIAAGLEAHGVTDRTAARFRHRDVFSLAEEMYARVPRDGEESTKREPAPSAPGARGGWAVLALLPGALCAAAVVGIRLTDGQPRLAVAALGALGALAVALGLRVALDRGPLRAPSGPAGRTRAWTCWLIAYALLGDGLLAAGLHGGPHGLWPPAVAPVLALALSCAPAVWCAHLLAVRARRKLATSRGLAEFADSVQPLILGVFALHLCALSALLALCGAVWTSPPGTPAPVPSAPSYCSPASSPRTGSPRPRPSPSGQPPWARRSGWARSSRAACRAAPSCPSPSRQSPTPGVSGPSPLSCAAPPRSSSSSTPPAP